MTIPRLRNFNNNKNRNLIITVFRYFVFFSGSVPAVGSAFALLVLLVSRYRAVLFFVGPGRFALDNEESSGFGFND